MNIGPLAAIFIAGSITASCSERSAPEREKGTSVPEAAREATREADDDKLQPRDDAIAEDCVAFVRSTKVVPASAPGGDCPGCPAEGTEVLAFREMRKNEVFCSGETCEVVVTIRASFNPGLGERIAGGLTAWISPEQRSEYLSGRPPSGDQAFRVKITYKRRGEAWRAIEFDRADPE